MDIQERLNLGREALEDNVLPTKQEAIFLYDLIHELQEENEQLKNTMENEIVHSNKSIEFETYRKCVRGEI